VIRVLVGDQQRSGAIQGGGRVAEGTGIDHQDRAVFLQPDA
jgi:hypothetical protein